MTTLRDFILDHRCPNCGTTMVKRSPRWPDTLLLVSAVAEMLTAVAFALLGEYPKAAYTVALGVFLLELRRNR